MKVARFSVVVLVSLAIVTVFSIQGYPALQNLGTDSRGYRLIYDTDLNITWYDMPQSTAMWQSAMNWASGLTVDFGGTVYDDWRLPTTVDGLYTFGYDGTTTGGYNITSSEIGHLFYTELENKGYYNTDGYSQPGYGLTNKGDLQSLMPQIYWSGTKYSADPAGAWGFNLFFGNQDIFSTDLHQARYIAVRSGMAVASVPEPISSTLFIIGGVTLGLRRLRRSNIR